MSRIRDTSGQDRPVDAGRGRRRSALFVGAAAVAVVLLVASSVWLRDRWQVAAHAVPAERVRIAEVVRGPFVRDVSARGIVVAAVSPTLYAPAAGTVQFAVQAGDPVVRGQVLARVDSPELLNELERESATFASLEIAVERQAIDTRRQVLASQQTADLAGVSIQAAERELKRAEDSWAERLISERDYEKARDDAAEARLAHAHALESAALEKESLEFELRTRVLERDRQRLLVEDLKRRAGELEVTSPVDGVVGTLAVAERTAVARNAPLVTVVDLSRFEIEFEVPETYADDLGLGMAAFVTYADRDYAATVAAISPEVRAGQVTGRLRFETDAPAGLRQSQRVSARILLESRDGVITVPRGPFLDSGGGRVAYRVVDGVAQRTPITVGASSISDVEILDGLAPGDQIVVSGVDMFQGAEAVRLVD
ncbi:MAG TPA: efflux RND transporter periplasmic adaptor subunit [Steroidobacteraceae bacterium]|nr:efflux RND transporter periplasmic adaptor subunit [Steroidobacteraceae bacterium]